MRARRRAISVLPQPVGPIISIFLNVVSFFYQTTHKEDRNRLAQSKLYEPIRKSLDVVVPLLDFDNFTEITKNDKKQI